MTVLDALLCGQVVPDRVVIVTAHPDDETVSMGGTLPLLAHATLVQLTDGAIDDPDAWTKAGVASREAYAALRAAERDAALRALRVDLPCLDVRCADQETVRRLDWLIDSVAAWLTGQRADVVFTHPYEGGHVDHDSAAFVVQQACAAMAAPPVRLEFASYHWDGTTRQAGVFWPVLSHPTAAVVIGGERLARKQAALACYPSQASVTRWFPVSREAYRVAPVYDFAKPPTTPACWYDRKAWKTTSAQWRAAAAAARQAVPA